MDIESRCAKCSLGMCAEHKFVPTDGGNAICLHCHGDATRSSAPPASENAYATAGEFGNALMIQSGAMIRMCKHCFRRRPVRFVCNHYEGAVESAVYFCEECTADGFVCPVCQPEYAQRQLAASPVVLG